MYKYIAFLCLFLKCVNTLNQLSFSGGGAFGAVELGILKRIHEIEPKKFDLYTGISAGALNAAFLSYYDNLYTGIRSAENLYSRLKTKHIYNYFPFTGLSLLNTKPLFKTLSKVVSIMPYEPIVHTLIGTTNLYTGKLDVHAFEEQDNINKVLLLMSSCAIPGIFPPIKFNAQLYADGGTLSNQLIQVEHDKNYLNVTFITPYDDLDYNDAPIQSIQDMLCRTIKIVLSNFNNPMASLNENCKNPIGEINKYYVPGHVLKGFNILNFEKSAELIDIGYNNVLCKKYIIC